MPIDRTKWKPIPPVLQSAIDTFSAWAEAKMKDEDVSNGVRIPLYHYTDAAGLEGIVKNQQVWLTEYRHLNDTSELRYGMDVATSLLKEIGQDSDGRIKMFCDMVIDLFTHHNMQTTFSVFIASFSLEGNDLGQWRAYGDDGKGYALGLAPHLFHVEDTTGKKPPEQVLVAPVAYGLQDGRQRHSPGIEKAVTLVGEAMLRGAAEMADINVGMPFLDEMAKTLIATQLVWNSLTIKHEAYRHEREVRLVIIGPTDTLHPFVSTRTRGPNIVPFIKSDMPLQAPTGVVKVVVGPDAPLGAENGVRSLLLSFVSDPDAIIWRSDIPYRSARW